MLLLQMSSFLNRKLVFLRRDINWCFVFGLHSTLPFTVGKERTSSYPCCSATDAHICIKFVKWEIALPFNVQFTIYIRFQAIPRRVITSLIQICHSGSYEKVEDSVKV